MTINTELINIANDAMQQRMVKSKEEIDMISKAINITNSSFLNSSGRYGELPPNSGSLVIVNKSKISFTNNYIVNSRGPNDDYFNDPANETHKLISLDPYPSDNFGINTSGNYFEHRGHGMGGLSGSHNIFFHGKTC